MHPLDSYIRKIPDFPKEGIIFRDITTITQEPEGLCLAIDSIEEKIKDLDFDSVVGLESRGFIFGSPIARDLSKGFSIIRKKGKLPWRVISQDYELEYGSETMEMHIDALQPGQKVVIIDDLLATGGTMEAGIKLCEKVGAEVVACIFLVELKGLKGREKLKDYRVESIVQYEGK